MASADVGVAIKLVPAPPPAKNVWGAPSCAAAALAAEAPSLADVMSEQLASELMSRDLSRFPSSDDVDLAPAEVPLDLPTEVAGATAESLDCEDDLLIAQMLQMQFDREYDDVLTKEERHQNGSSKVTVSYSKYKVIPDNPVWDESEEEDEFLTMDDRKRHWDLYETKEKETGVLPRCGYRKVGDLIVTKHDREISQRSNGKRIMEFPPGIETGDGGGIDMQLSNSVYNKIRNFANKDGKRKNRVRDKEDKSTSDKALDQQTRILLFKMVNNCIVERVNGVISTGKEAVILHAEGGKGTSEEDMLKIPAECAIKVFKTTLNEFKTRDKYIKDDYRFRDRFGKQNPRKIVHIWAEKELHNLLKMQKFGVRVPEPVMLKKHILVMAFIGKDGVPAPKLKEADLTRSELESAHEQVVTMMKKLYSECHLVHADLSAYNILWHEKKCWFIDVSQSVEPNHPHGLEFLMRDCINVVDFFSSHDLDDVGSAQELFTAVSGLPIEEGGKTEAEIFGQVRDYEKNAEILSGLGPSDKSYPFDYCWDKSKSSESTAPRTAPEPIPGHPRPRNGKSGKSPKSPRSFPPPAGKSPKSPSAFMSMTDEELRRVKEVLIEDNDEPHEATHVKFDDI